MPTPLKPEVIYIFWTCRNQSEAKKILHALLNQKLIACASLFPKVESIYRWNGNIEESLEVKIILKSVNSHFNAIESYIRDHCSYQVPEVVQVDVRQGNPGYLSWVVEETTL